MQAFVSTQLAGFASWLGSMFNGLVEQLFSIVITPIAMILYSLQIGFFWLIDCIQGIFRSMAGLDLYYYQGEEQSGDMVLSMLMSDTVMSIFWGVLVVAIMLLFVTTFVAIIRSEFVEKGANPKGVIIGRSIKALFYFAAVPVVCLFGIWIANIFLKSLDEATSNQSSSLSTTVFFAASHDANRCRSDYDFAMKVKDSEIGEYLGLKGTSATQEEIATAIDIAFLRNMETPGDHTFNITGDHMWALSLFTNTTNYSITTFDTENFAFTYYFYDLFMGYNYLIGFMGGFIAASLLLSACIGIIQRLFELSILFIISPTVIAFMPLDDGKKYNQWRGEFIKRVGSMYGPVIGLNLLFMLLAVMSDIDIFYPDTGIYAVFNSIVQLIFLIVGLLAVKDFSSLISSIAGSGDVMAEGEKKKEGVQKMVGRVGAGTINAVRTGSQLTRAVGKDITRGAIGGARKFSQKIGLSDRLSPAFDKWHQSGVDNDKYFTDKDGNIKRKFLTRGRMQNVPLFGKLSHNEDFSGDINDFNKIKFGTDAYDINTHKLAIAKDDKGRETDTQAAKIAAKRMKGGLLAQGMIYTSGQGYKTGLGTAFDAFLKSAGKDVGMLGRESMTERAKNGESIIGAMPIFRGKDAFGEPIRTRGNITTHDALYKTEKETKDAIEDAEHRRKSELKTEEEYIANKKTNGERGTTIAGGVLQQSDERPLRVEVVKDRTEGNNNNNNTSNIISSLNDAMSKLAPQLSHMADSAKAMADMNKAMQTASAEISAAARGLKDSVLKFNQEDHK